MYLVRTRIRSGVVQEGWSMKGKMFCIFEFLQGKRIIFFILMLMSHWENSRETIKDDADMFIIFFDFFGNDPFVRIFGQL